MIDRRDLFRGALFGAGASMFSRSVMASVARAVAHSPNATGASRLLVVFLRGGNDALNTLIPIQDLDYHTFRPGNAGIVDANQLPITGATFATMNAELSRLVPVDQAGRIAWLHRVGDSAATRSHFTAMDRLETAADPATPLAGVANLDGYVAGLLAAGGMPAMSAQGWPSSAGFSERPMRMFRTDDPSRFSAHVRDLGAMALPSPIPATQSNLVPPLYDHATTHASQVPFNAMDELVAHNIGYGIVARDRLETLGFAPGFATTGLFPLSAGDLAAAAAANPGANVPTWDPKGEAFLRSAEQAVFALENVPGLRYAAVDFGGWDTHGDQPEEHPKQLRYLGWGLRDLDDFLQNSPIGASTVVLVVSEFGRTIQANANDSTDHGVGGMALVMGDCARAGTYHVHGGTPGAREHGNQWSSLTTQFNANTDALDVVTEWRDILAHICDKVFQVPSAQMSTVIPGYTGPGPGFINFLL